MPNNKPFFVIHYDNTLEWPSDFRTPTKYFRLFVAANTADLAMEKISRFIEAVLGTGMLYLCVWGAGCSRFHDIADAIIVEDDLGKQLFAGPDQKDTIMTTWHENESLADALEYFVVHTLPTQGFEAESNYWLAIIADNPDWAVTTQRYLEQNLK